MRHLNELRRTTPESVLTYIADHPDLVCFYENMCTSITKDDGARRPKMELLLLVQATTTRHRSRVCPQDSTTLFLFTYFYLYAYVLAFTSIITVETLPLPHLRRIPNSEAQILRVVMKISLYVTKEQIR